MTQRDRDRLEVLKRALKKQITQKQAAEELEITERHVRRLLVRLREQGDRAVIHGLRGRSSNRKLDADVRSQAVQILSREVYRGFGPTLASEYLAKKHKLSIGREALRQLMLHAGLWRRRRQKIEAIHEWRARKSSRGEMVQWDTSGHDWLEGRGPKLYLIHLIDDATSELTARFVEHDSTEENMRLLWTYLERHGRPLAFYTDKASLFQTAPKIARDHQQRPQAERPPLPPTQIGRGLRELGIAWIPAHSPQAKGRIERSFATAQDRLVKGLRVAQVSTLEQANRYLETEFLSWWNSTLTVLPANTADAHRPLNPQHDLASTLCQVHTRQVANDYTIQFRGHIYQIARSDIRAGLRGSSVRLENRLDGSLALRFRDRYLHMAVCEARHPLLPTPTSPSPASRNPPRTWMRNFHVTDTPSLYQLSRNGTLNRF